MARFRGCWQDDPGADDPRIRVRRLGRGGHSVRLDASELAAGAILNFATFTQTRNAGRATTTRSASISDPHHSESGAFWWKLPNVSGTPANEEPILVYATSWCGDCRLAKSVLDERHAHYRWIDINRKPSAVETVLRLNGGYRTVPTIIFPDGRVLVEPSRQELEQALTESASAA